MSSHTINMWQSLIWLMSCSLWLSLADIIVMTRKSNFTEDVFADLPASFGASLPVNGLKGLLVHASPSNACEPLFSPPQFGNYTGKWFVLIRRYDCSFVEKVRTAEQAGYDAAIIYNVGSNVIEPMAGDGDDINIPAVFVGQDDGLLLASHYQYDQGYKLLITNELPFNINSYLLPFAIVVAICFVVMVIFMVVKCVKDRRRMRRYRLPSSSLKSIPTSKFKKGDPYDTCAICLEDYVDGDKLRILPACSHAYHSKCVDPWLTRNRRVCPVCKRRVLARGETISDSESEHDDDERRPLLRPGSYGTQGGTFSRSPGDVIVAPLQSVEGEGNEQEAIIHIERSDHAADDSIVVDSSEDTTSVLVDEDGSDRNRMQTSTPDLGQATPPTQTLEDTSIYFTPQHTASSHETLDV